MKWLGWTVGVGAFLVMMYFTALPGNLAVGLDGDDPLAGTYTINGIDNTGAGYSGTVTIRAGDTPGHYEFEWIITGAVQRGSGEVVGDTLRVEWASTSSAAPASGYTVYIIQADGRLVGERFVNEVPGFGSEELFPEA